MTKTKTTPTPSPLLDASGNPTLVSPGELIESSWGNAVAGRVVARYPSKTALDTSSASDGTLAITTDSNVVYMRIGGTWRPTRAGAVDNFRMVGGAGGQSIPPSTLTTCIWKSATSEPAGLVPDLTNFHVPTGWGGRWMFEWAVEWGVGGAVGARLVFLAVGGQRIGETTDKGQEGGTRLAGTGSVVLTAGTAVNIQMYHTDSAGALVCNTTTNNYFQGHYLGPN